MTFLKVLLIIIVSLWLFKILARFFLPLFLTWFVKRTFSKMQGNFDFNTQQQTTQSSDNITFNASKASKKKTSNNKGDYVDFEEVK